MVFEGKPMRAKKFLMGSMKRPISPLSPFTENTKPTSEDLEGIDVLVFDIQDVGARFYTYLSTLHYIMEAAAENSKKSWFWTARTRMEIMLTGL